MGGVGCMMRLFRRVWEAVWLDFLMAWERRMVMIDTRRIAIGSRDRGIWVGVEGLRRFEGIFF